MTISSGIQGTNPGQFNNLQKIDKITGESSSLKDLSAKELDKKVSNLGQMSSKDQEIFLKQLQALVTDNNLRAIETESMILNSPSLSKSISKTCENMVRNATSKDSPTDSIYNLSRTVVYLGTRNDKNLRESVTDLASTLLPGVREESLRMKKEYAVEFSTKTNRPNQFSQGGRYTNEDSIEEARNVTAEIGRITAKVILLSDIKSISSGGLNATYNAVKNQRNTAINLIEIQVERKIKDEIVRDKGINFVTTDSAKSLKEIRSRAKEELNTLLPQLGAYKKTNYFKLPSFKLPSFKLPSFSFKLPSISIKLPSFNFSFPSISKSFDINVLSSNDRKTVEIMQPLRQKLEVKDVSKDPEPSVSLSKQK